MARPLAVLAVALLASLCARGPPAQALAAKKQSAAPTPRSFEDLPEVNTKEPETPSNCSTPASLPGNCVRIQNCRPLYALMLQRINGVQVDFLRRSQCGFEGRSPKVCCAQKGRAPSQSGQIPDWSRVSGFTPLAAFGVDGSTGLARDSFPADVVVTQPRSCGQQHASMGLSRYVGGVAAKNDSVVKSRWVGMCVENSIPQHVGRLLSFAPRRVCDPAPTPLSLPLQSAPPPGAPGHETASALPSSGPPGTGHAAVA